MISEMEFQIVRRYLNHLARGWWDSQPVSRAVATCDACSVRPIGRDEGYLIGGTLYCQTCFDDKASDLIRRDPDNAGYNTLAQALTWSRTPAAASARPRMSWKRGAVVVSAAILQLLAVVLVLTPFVRFLWHVPLKRIDAGMVLVAIALSAVGFWLRPDPTLSKRN